MNNLNLLLNLPIAHRGLHNDLIPENTIHAIDSAFKNNFNCEIDVRLTKDNKVIVFHDDSLFSFSIFLSPSPLPPHRRKNIFLITAEEQICSSFARQ